MISTSRKRLEACRRARAVDVAAEEAAAKGARTQALLEDLQRARMFKLRAQAQDRAAAHAAYAVRCRDTHNRVQAMRNRLADALLERGWRLRVIHDFVYANGDVVEVPNVFAAEMEMWNSLLWKLDSHFETT